MATDPLGNMAEHQTYMRRCIHLAQQARNRGNTPVGSLVVIDGHIVGEGVEQLPAGTNLAGHAELIACQQAVERTNTRRLVGAVLYTTAEPCFMCSYVIRQCGIATVVYGVDTPGVGGVTSLHPILTDASLAFWNPPPRVLAHVLQAECQQLKSPRRGNSRSAP